MDSLLEFVRAMTFWNWIALIAFIFFPLSALNAFLSLRSRFQNWNATRSKEKFEKRVRQIQSELSMIYVLRGSITSLAVEVTRRFALTLYLFLTAVLNILIFGLFRYFTSSGPGFEVFSYACASLSTLLAMYEVWNLLRLTRVMFYPEHMAEKAIKLIYKGKASGWVAADDDTLINGILNHKAFTDVEREHLNKVVTNLPPLKV